MPVELISVRESTSEMTKLMKSKSQLKTSTAFWLLFAVGALVMAVTGCDNAAESGFVVEDESDVETVSKPKPLRLLAINMPEFGDEIARQWSAQRDGELSIQHVGFDEFDDSPEVADDVDLIVHPATINYDLISKKLIRPISRDAMEDEDLNRSAFLQHFRKALVRHGDETWSVSLGDHQLRLFYRKDILDAAKIEPPRTWEELFEAARELTASGSAGEIKMILVPRSEGFAANLFMARAASLIRDRGKLTTFFDRKTMKPTLEAKPFERALSDVKILTADSTEGVSVPEVFASFAAGESVFAIAWPSLLDSVDQSTFESQSQSWGVARLPGSAESFDLKEKRWQNRARETDVRVDLFGVGSTNISIAASSAYSRDAMDFVIWLTDKSNSQKLLPSTAAPFRATHLANLDRWYNLDQVSRDFSEQLADSLTETHRANIFLMFPQIRGSRQYLKLLDDEVAKFLSSDSSHTAKTLSDIVKKWETLTEEYGRNPQVHALRGGNDL